jgi:peptidoglycan/xylan/chitin deacetylase (PgdA/CDA1 family)
VKKFNIPIICLVAILFLSFFVFSINYSKADSLSQGVISIVFDDNYDNQFDYAWPSMEQRGLVGTFYIRTGTMESSGYMSYNELQILQAAGNEIASHSITHRDFTSLSDNDIRNECLVSKQTLENYGLLISNFAYPSGHTNNNVDSIVDNYYRSGRTAYIPPYLINDPSSQFRLPGFSSEDTPNELESLKNIVDQIYSSNEWAIVLFHNIIPNDYTSQYTTSLENFEEFLDYTMSKNVRILTVDQTLDTIIPITITSNYGTTNPESGLYELGSSLIIEAVVPVAGVGERFIWEGWSGSGEGSYSGMNNPITVIMNQAVTEHVSWAHQFIVNFNLNGVGADFSGNVLTIDNEDQSNDASLWLDVGFHSFSINKDLFVNTVKKYTWVSSSGLTSQRSGQISVTKSGSINANFKIQYYVDISSQRGNTTGEGWYDVGESVITLIDSPIITDSENVRFVFSGWTIDGSGINSTSDPIVVNTSISIVASWQKQNLITFNQEGLPSDYKLGIIVNSRNHNLPFSDWFDEGDIIDFNYPDQIITESAEKYILTFPTNTSITPNSPTTLTAAYYLEPTMNRFVLIILTVIIGSLLIALILLRKNKII